MDIKEIAKECGHGVVSLSLALGLSRGALSQWTIVPHDHVLPLCQMSDWRLTPHKLRPDIYPNPLDALPPEVAAQKEAA